MIFLNGQFMPIEKASISVLDRGFIFGDGVYEVIPVYSRRPFRLDKHLHRLQHSLDGIRLKNPYTTEQWSDLIGQVVDKNAGDDQSIYLHITRGVAKRDHPFPDVPPTVFMMSNPLLPPLPESLEKGVAAITASDNRWIRCDIKSISLLPNVLLRQIAVDAGAAETILIRDGFLTEGSASNIFVVKDQVLLAPPKSHLMLPGITYDVLLELVAENHVIHEVREISEDELFSAEEIMLTSSTREIMAVTRLNEQSVGTGSPGAMFRQLHQFYQQYKATHMRGGLTC
ncbi:D-amino acid aminotransferase [Nitrosomonas marina]|uniref:D-alanine transaminase n=1 Tax=Nitrosomonas marina TaxID=917 RepID=A0A1H8B998_9PROT|nr:D-amino acid aminotransferase [Nitrosomonas marina]SEM79515.1 D-alanine transaminase [Nitrosomonas marina]